MQVRYYCPRCRTRTMIIDNDVLICTKCGFAVSIEILNMKFPCITPDVIKKLPSKLRSRVRAFLHLGRLMFVKKFDIKSGIEHICLDVKNMRDKEALELIKKIEILFKI